MKTFPFVQQTQHCSLLLAIYLLASQAVWAQCPNDNTPINTIPFSLTCGTGSETIATGVSGGQYVAMNVVAGSEYTFETCGLSDSGFDTEMTIYEDDGTFIDHNDDDCGTDSRITFTANATGVIRVLIDVSGCASNTAETGIVASCTAPPACTITATFLGNPSACNDNGTNNDPSDDFFTQNVQATFFNRPLTGSLQIVPGGDQIGTYSIAANQIIGNSHIFNNVQFKADGTPSNVQMNFTDEPTCIDAATGPTVQPCSSNTPSCEIIGFSFANIGPCNDNGTPSNPSDDFFEVDVDVLYSNSFPALFGSVQLVGFDVIGTYSTIVPSGSNLTVTFPGVKLRADGQATDLEGQLFVPFLGVQCSLAGIGPAVNSCSNTPPNSCEIIGVSFANIGPCNDNGTPSNPSDDFFEVDVDVLYSNSFPALFGSVQLVGADVIGTYSTIVPSGLNLTVTFPDVKLRADGQATDLEGQLFVPFLGVQCSLPGTGPAVNACSNTPPNSCEIIGFSFANIGPCNDNGTPNDDTDDFFEVDVDVIYSNSDPFQTLFINGTDVISGASTIAQIGTNLTQTFTGLRFRADGQITEFNGAIQDGIANIICSLPGTGPAVNACSNGGSPSCEVIGFTFDNISGCNSNGTPNDISDDFFSCDVSMIYTNPFANALQLGLNGPPPLIAVPGNGAPAGFGSNLTHTFQNVKFLANGQPVTFSGTISGVTGLCATLSGTGPAVNPCPCPQVTLTSGPSIQNVECDGSGNTTELDAWLAAGGFAQVDLSSGTIVSITHNTPTVTLFCGNVKRYTTIFTFTNDCGNSAHIGGVFTILDNTPPTLVCPTPVQVSCFEQIPPANTTLVTGVSDVCGSTPITVEHVSDASGPDGICDNDFTITRTYRATDDCGNFANCTQTITIRDQTPPTITCAAQTTPLNCPATPVFTPPTASDNCVGNVAITFSDVNVPGTCPGTFTTTRTWTATDPCQNTATCARSITVRDVTPPPVPANTASTVACPALATAPVPPVVIDACAGAITPTGPAILNNPNPLTCEGTRTFTFTFTDCSGNASQWSHTYTIEQESFTINVPFGNATVACPDDTDIVPAPPIVTSNCGEVLPPVLLSIGAKPGCEGQRQYIFRYTDCEGNFADWLFTYRVEYQDFAIPPSEQESVECPILATEPTPPTVFDNCGKLLTPIGPAITSTDNAQACEASRTYTFTYKDCEGNTHSWNKTYHFLYSADFFVFNDETNVVTCLAYAVQPFPPTLYDACGNEIKATLTNVTEDNSASGCTGWRKFEFEYTDCGGHSHPWRFTYEINDNEAPLGTCPSGNGGTATQNSPVSVNVSSLSCIEEVPCPDDYDFSEKIEDLLMAGNYFDGCSGNDLVVELQGSSDLWECADPDGDGQFTFGRTFYFRIADPCGNEYPGGCEVTYSGECLPIETFRQEDWGVAGAMPGNAISVATSDLSVIEDMLAYGAVKIGGSHRSLSLTDAQCIVDMLPGTGGPSALANCHQTNCTGCNPMGIGGLKNSLAANTIALTLNFRFNQEYKGLTDSALRHQSLDCVDIHECITDCSATDCHLRMFDQNGGHHQFPYTLGGLLDMANQYLDGGLGLSIGQQTIYGTAINQALVNVHAYWSSQPTSISCGTNGSTSPIGLESQAISNGEKPTQGIDFSLSPNPASRSVMLKLGNLNEERKVQVEVFNTLGNRLIFNDLGEATSVQHSIEIGSLKTGMYVVMVTVNGYRPMVQKLFVNNEAGLNGR